VQQRGTKRQLYNVVAAAVLAAGVSPLTPSLTKKYANKNNFVIMYV